MLTGLVLAVLLAPPASLRGQSSPQDEARDMAFVPAGEFWMGRARLWLIDEIGWMTRERMDDRPVHQVGLDAFYIDRHEVTNEAYARFVQASGHRAPHSSCPRTGYFA